MLKNSIKKGGKIAILCTMPIDRFYSDEPLELGSLVRLPHNEDRHMRQVMRKRIGDTVELFDGKGRLVTAMVSHDKELTVKELLADEAREPSITIAQALLAPSKLDWITEKCAELGALALWFYPADGSEKSSMSDNLLARLKTIAISAAKQSGRLFLTDIIVKPPLKEWPLLDNLYWGDQQGITRLPTQKDFVFVVGPEKGFSVKERALLQKHRALSLSQYTLRTETAALVLLAKLL